MSLLASILVFEGFLLVYFQCWSEPEINSRQIGGVVLGKRGVRTNQTNYPWIRHWIAYVHYYSIIYYGVYHSITQ